MQPITTDLLTTLNHYVSSIDSIIRLSELENLGGVRTHQSTHNYGFLEISNFLRNQIET